MKVKILNKEGKDSGEINTTLFSHPIREDISQKYVQTLIYIQPHAPYKEAGKRHVASGITSRVRHKFKTGYGHQRARTPRKILWRRGTQFYWVGAEVANTRGGRRAHPPKIEHFLIKKKINKKEKNIAMLSAISSTSSLEMIQKRYERLNKMEKKLNFPIIFNKEVLKLKTKDFFKLIEKIFENNKGIVIQEKSVRAGKGKSRNRKYKKNAGMLMIIGKKEKFEIQGITVVKTNELNIKDLWPLGRLAVYTEDSIKELQELFEKKS